jgi:hypothetical protein
LDDQIIAESGLNGRSHTGFADQRRAFSVLLPVKQEEFQPFSPDLNPRRGSLWLNHGSLWLNHQSVCFLPGSLPLPWLTSRRSRAEGAGVVIKERTGISPLDLLDK